MARLLPVTCISYNVMSMVQAGRWQDVDREFAQYGIVALQGTRDRLVEACEQHQTEHFRWHRWKYGRGGCSNRACGVAIGLNKKMYSRESVKQVYPVPAKYAGRVGILRIKEKKGLDLLVVTLYLPVEGRSGHCEDLLRWLEKLLRAAPQRTLPIICGDMNAHIGDGGPLTRVEARRSDCPFQCIGPHAIARENGNGALLRTFLERVGYVAANSFYNSDPTYYSGDGNSFSHIDMFLLPWDVLKRISCCKTLTTLGDRVQLARTAGRVDHRPILVKLWHRTFFDDDEQHRKMQFGMDKVRQRSRSFQAESTRTGSGSS